MSRLPPDLSELVFSIIERNDRLGGQPTLELPELRPKLQFFFGDPYIFDFNRGAASPAPVAGLWGPKTVTTHSLPGRHVHVFIIDLYPQALDALGLGPMREFVDAVIPLEVLIGARAVEWYEEMQAALSFQSRSDVCLRWLRQLRTGRATTCSRAMVALAQIVNTGASTVEQISACVDVCPRLLRRHFSNEIGLSPKFAMRLQRFNRALVRLHPQPWDSSTEDEDPIASFHDQAHFIKDFQAFTGGVTPKAFVDAKRRTGDALVTTLIQPAL